MTLPELIILIPVAVSACLAGKFIFIAARAALYVGVARIKGHGHNVSALRAFKVVFWKVFDNTDMPLPAYKDFIFFKQQISDKSANNGGNNHIKHEDRLNNDGRRVNE